MDKCLNVNNHRFQNSMAGVKLGDRVKVVGKNLKGEIAFIGNTDFSEGTWIGIILDDAKGRNNGTVDGRRYFICPKNHGIFVRICQVEKECLERTVEIEEKQNEVTSKRIIYPNYLKASSKLKSIKRVGESKNGDPTEELQEKNPGNQSTETDFKNVEVELESIKDENKTLKNKLKEREKSFHKSKNEYSKAMEEIKHLKADIECKKKQIKVRKCHIKMLKMRQCNRYKKVESSRSKASRTGDNLAGQGNTADGELDVSDDEFDFECMKTLASMERIVELEEQNGIMIQGLVELREFLKSICESPVQDSEIPGLQSKHRKNVKRGDSYLFTNFMNSFPTGQSNTNLSAITSDRKNYSDMLLELTKFTEYVSKGEKDFGTQNKKNCQQAGDFNPAQNVSSYGDKIIQCSYKVPNELLHNNRSSLNTSGIPAKSAAFQNTLPASSNNYTNKFQVESAANRFQSIKSGDSQKQCNYRSKSKVNSQLGHIGDTVQSKYENPVDELKRLMSAMNANSKLHPCPSKTSLIEQNRMDAQYPSFGI